MTIQEMKTRILVSGQLKKKFMRPPSHTTPVYVVILLLSQLLQKAEIEE
jgi:hypothetical protein